MLYSVIYIVKLLKIENLKIDIYFEDDSNKEKIVTLNKVVGLLR